jgi:hypothetical protein
MSSGYDWRDEERHAPREFWTQDADGRDVLVAVTFGTREAEYVWYALKRARAYIEERTNEPHRYKGRFLRSWSEDEGYLYPEDLEARGISP